MANYLLKYKGTYRILPSIDLSTNDFPRHIDGSIDDTDIYISCQYGNQIFTYGHIDNKKAVWLIAYIPSLGRGRNIVNKLKNQNIQFIDYEETDEEVLFKFQAKDIDLIANLLKAKTSGANISPFSTKNLPKSNVEIPLDEIERYKVISAKVQKSDLLIIHRIIDDFLNTIIQKRQKKSDKTFDYKLDIRKKCMSRQTKEYIWSMGYWDEFLKYFNKQVDLHYNK